VFPALSFPWLIFVADHSVLFPTLAGSDSLWKSTSEELVQFEVIP
jgi:hypothetical protein